MEKGELRPEVLVEPELREGEVVMVFQVRIVVLLKELFGRVQMRTSPTGPNELSQAASDGATRPSIPLVKPSLLLQE